MAGVAGNAPFTPEQREFLRGRIPSGARPAQIAREFNARFERQIRRQSVRNFALREGIEPGWQVRMTPGDYQASTDRARRYIRRIWAAAHGPVPDGMCVVQAEPAGRDPSTMRLVSRADLAVMNREGLRWSDQQTLAACVAAARVLRRAAEARRRDDGLRRARQNLYAARHRARVRAQKKPMTGDGPLGAAATETNGDR